jgi:hypothetical protein
MDFSIQGENQHNTRPTGGTCRKQSPVGCSPREGINLRIFSVGRDRLNSILLIIWFIKGLTIVLEHSVHLSNTTAGLVS